MITIPIVEEDGSEPLPSCRGPRAWLVDQYKLGPMVALRFFSDDFPISENDRASNQGAVEHVRQCPACQAWIQRVIPKEMLRRQSRLARYCCAGMFVAVEEANPRTENKITFEVFRGEDPCWMIDGRSSFISYCPWCGKKLPDHPFIEES